MTRRSPESVRLGPASSRSLRLRLKIQAPSSKLQAPSSLSHKRQASSPKHKGSSAKPQAASSWILEPGKSFRVEEERSSTLRMLNMERNLMWRKFDFFTSSYFKFYSEKVARSIIPQQIRSPK